MPNHKHHKIFIGLTAVIILIVGLFLGTFLTANLGEIDLQVVNIGLAFTNTILILLIGGLALDLREMLLFKPRGKQ